MDKRRLVLILSAFALALQTPAAANEPNVADAPSFESDILPILQSRCHACHGGNESKGGLTLESVQTMLNGAESGSVVVPGQPKQSYLLHRIRRREMPPKGREPVTEAERKLIDRATDRLKFVTSLNRSRRYRLKRPIARRVSHPLESTNLSRHTKCLG